MLEMITGILGAIWFYLWTSFVLMMVVWFFFINAMLLRKKQDKLKKNKLIYYPVLFLFIIGYLLDIILNYYAGVFNYVADRISGYSHKDSVFMPEIDYSGINKNTIHRLTMTARLRHIKRTRLKNSWTYKMANFICYNMLRPFDREHCSISEIITTMKTVAK